MKLLFLRGKADRPKDIAYPSIEACVDTWEQLAFAMTGAEDTTKVLYWGGNRKVYYADNFSIHWIHDFHSYAGMEPDTIIARGGFKEYVPLLKDYPDAFKVYYGANHGVIPNDGIKYDLILCDSPQQKEKAEKHGYKAELFIKPAPPQFKPMDIDKKYDCLFAAVWPEDERKHVRWVYKTVPKDLSVLQVGHYPKAKVPANVKVKMLGKNDMPKAICKSRVVIAPYKSADSCPRIIPEALACGVPVIALKDVNVWKEKYKIAMTPKNEFWQWVRTMVRNHEILSAEIREYYSANLCVKIAGEYLKNLIERHRNG